MMRVLPEIDYPDYLPENARAWAREHRELLEVIVEDLLKTGTWPTLKALTRRLAQERRPALLQSIFWQMPKPLGFMESDPERVMLTPFGLRATHAGQKLLAGFTAILTLAAERYVSEESDPVITRADVARGAVDSDPYVTALSEILLRGVPFLGGGMGRPEEDWSRTITDGVVRYLDVQNTEDYLRALAAELTGSPQLGWLPMAAPQGNHPASETGREPRDLPRQPNIGPITTSTGLDDQRDVFISHASEDKDVIARPIAEELLRRGRSVWFDEFELTLGDSLRRSIDRGLAESRFGLVILSPSFFAKQWPQRELDGLTTREIAGSTKVILPVWHEVDHAYGPRREFDLASANDFLSREIGWIQKHIVLDRILSPSIYQQAFGAPGQSGDPNKIEGMARRLLSVYESWLDWAAGLRNTSVPPAYEEVLETTACLIDGPVLSVREFIDHVAHETARLPELAADGTDEHPITLTFELKLDIEDEVVDRNDFRALMENEAPGHLGSLNFDLRGTRADEATAGAIQNYMVRTRGGWESHFLCVPNFTVSSVSPGLQAADVIAYLGAHLAPGQDRPELQPYVDRMRGLTYQFTRPGRSARHIRTARRVG